jgi:hypothetical protein
MDDLLSGKSKKPAAQELPKPNKQPIDEGTPHLEAPVAQDPSPLAVNPQTAPVSRATPRPQKQKTKTPTIHLRSDDNEEEKVKVTFYVSEEIQYDLDDAQLQLRRLAPNHVKKNQLSKSAVVEAALRIVIDNLEAERENSALAQYLFA